MCMKTFEEKFTAWVDGKLAGAELAEFERSLEPAQLAERGDAQKLGALLRDFGRGPALGNADFFNAQILRALERPAAPARRSFWSLPRLAWAGACCLALALAVFALTVPGTRERSAGGSVYRARVLTAEPGDKTIYASSFTAGDRLAVVWLDGLEDLPDTQGL